MTRRPPTVASIRKLQHRVTTYQAVCFRACGIKRVRRRDGRRVRGSHQRYELFVPYGDAQTYRSGLVRLRRMIQQR